MLKHSFGETWPQPLVLRLSPLSSFPSCSCLHPELHGASSACVCLPQTIYSNPAHNLSQALCLHVLWWAHSTNSIFSRMDLEKSSDLKREFELFEQEFCHPCCSKMGLWVSDGCVPWSLCLLIMGTTWGGQGCSSLKSGANHSFCLGLKIVVPWAA